MLISTTTTTPTPTTTPKQIVIGNIAINTVMYTVPAGRKFIGKIAHIAINNPTYINGKGFYFYDGYNTYFPKAMALTDITLLEGTEVKEGYAAGGTILGVEYDA